MPLLLALLFLALSATAAAAQNVTLSLPVTPGHLPVWFATGVIGDAGTASAPNPNNPITSIGVTADGQGICQNSGPENGPYQRLCFFTSLSQAGAITFDAINGASPQALNFVVNGAIASLPTLTGSTTQFYAGDGTFRSINAILKAPVGYNTSGVSGLGASGSAAVDVNSGAHGGVILLTAAAGAAATGNVTITPVSGSMAWPCVLTPFNDGGVWNGLASMVLGSGSGTASITVQWSNNAVALTSGQVYKVTFVCNSDS